MASPDLIAQALDVNAANLELGHDAFDAESARFVKDARVQQIYDANHVARVTASAPADIDRLLARAEAEYAVAGNVIFRTDFRTPPGFEARLQLEGYARTDALVMLLEGSLRGEAREVDIRPIESDADWDAFVALSSADWAEYRDRKAEDESADVGQQMALANRWKSPPVRYYLAWVEGEARGYFNAWEGIAGVGVGQVENLFVHAAWRHRGIATALIHRCVADARSRGAGPVVIVSDPTDTPKHMYAAMGWLPVAISRSYRKAISPPS